MTETPAFQSIMRPARAVLACLVAVNAAALLVMLVLLSADILIRYVEQSSIHWLHETSGIVFGALYLLGTVEVYARRKDVDLDVIGPLLRGRVFHGYAAARHLLLAVTFLALAWFSWILILGMEGDRTPMLRLPSSLYQYPVLVSAVLIAAYSLLDAVAEIIAMRSGTRPETIDGAALDD